jgi:hypothetical protein
MMPTIESKERKRQLAPTTNRYVDDLLTSAKPRADLRMGATITPELKFSNEC